MVFPIEVRARPRELLLLLAAMILADGFFNAYNTAFIARDDRRIQPSVDDAIQRSLESALPDATNHSINDVVQRPLEGDAPESFQRFINKTVQRLLEGPLPASVQSSINRTDQRPLEGNPSTTIDNPFQTPYTFDLLIERGAHIVSPRTACRISFWVVESSECDERTNLRKALSANNAHEITANDTIFVPLDQLQLFVNETLPHITAEVVIIAGRFQNMRKDDYDGAVVAQVTASPMVLHFFCMNLSKYGGSNPRHPKISSFPFGLKETGHDPTLSAYRDFLLSLHHNSSLNTNGTAELAERRELIFAGALKPMSPARYPNFPGGSPARAMILAQVGRIRLGSEDFFRRIASAEFVLSPDGDRPDCHRHYEAIGLGAIPVTQLDADLYGHFGNNAIYNNTDWNLTTLRPTLLASPKYRKANRNLIFDEYWMGYCDQIVGRRLQWWDDDYSQPINTDDILRKQRCTTTKRGQTLVKRCQALSNTVKSSQTLSTVVTQPN